MSLMVRVRVRVRVRTRVRVRVIYLFGSVALSCPILVYCIVLFY